MSNRTNLSASYNYTVTAAPDNSAYLWSGHGLENAPNPTIYIRSDDDITITNASGGHIMELSADFVAWSVTESNGQIVLVSDPALFGEGEYTYVCTSHPAMTGKLIVSHVVADGGPEDGYGTGPLPEAQNAIKMDAIRTKINEIVTKGGIGGASVGTVLPTSALDGDLFYDETTGALYIYLEDISAWVQTNGGAGSGSIEVSDTAPSSPSNGDLWFNTTEGELYVYVASETAWIQTNGGSSSGGSGGIFASGRVQISDGALQSGSHNVTSSSLVTTDEFEITLGSTAPDDAIVFLTSENTGSFTFDANFDIEFRWGSDGTNRSVINAFVKNSSDEYLNFVVFSPSTGGGGTGGASIEVSDTAPASPSDGNLWFNTTEAELYVYVAAEGAWVQTNGGGGAGNGNFSTGWVNTDGTTAVANGATLNFDHNLGTEDLIVQVYMAKDANGTDQTLVVNELVQSGGLNFEWGCQVQNVTSSQLTVQLLQEGTVVFNSVAHTAYNWGTTWTHIKVVASSGAGSGPRAYVAFDGTAADLTASITNSFNVASITDGGVGLYYVDLTSPILDPVATLAAGQTTTWNFVEKESFRYYASTSGTLGSGTSQVGGSIARIFIGFGDPTEYRDAKPISLVVH